MKYALKLKLLTDSAVRRSLVETEQSVTRLAKWAIQHATSKYESRDSPRYHQAGEKFPTIGRRLLLLTLDDAYANIRSLGAIKLGKKGWPIRLDKDNSKLSLDGENLWLEAGLWSQENGERERILLDVNVKDPSPYYIPLIEAAKRGETPPAKILHRRGEWWVHITLEGEPQSWVGELSYGIDLNKRSVVVAGIDDQGAIKLVKFISMKELLARLSHLDEECSGLQSAGLWKERARNRMEYRDAIRGWLSELTGELRKIFEVEGHRPKIVALENLRNLRGRQDWQNRKWARRKIREAIQGSGPPLIEVSSAGTSSRCYRCGGIIVREGWRAFCPACNKLIHADLNAAINIALRGGGKQPRPAISQGAGSKCQGPSQPVQWRVHMGLDPPRRGMGVNERASVAPKRRRSRKLHAEVTGMGGEGETSNVLQRPKEMK